MFQADLQQTPGAHRTIRRELCAALWATGFLRHWLIASTGRSSTQTVLKKGRQKVTTVSFREASSTEVWRNPPRRSNNWIHIRLSPGRLAREDSGHSPNPAMDSRIRVSVNKPWLFDGKYSVAGTSPGGRFERAKLQLGEPPDSCGALRLLMARTHSRSPGCEPTQIRHWSWTAVGSS